MKITLTKLIGDICYKVFGVQANIHVIHAIQSAVLHKLQTDNPILDKYQEEESKELNQLYSQLTPEEKDLVGLYNNHILRRGSEQFSKPVIKLPNTLEEACKYYQEINPRD